MYVNAAPMQNVLMQDVLNENNYNKLLHEEYLNAALGASVIVGSKIAQSIFSISGASSITIAMCGGILIGKSIGINTALSKVTSSIENRINVRYSITTEEYLNLCDKVYWNKIGSIVLFTACTILSMSEILDPSSQALLIGGTLTSYWYGEAKGINDSLKEMGLPDI